MTTVKYYLSIYVVCDGVCNNNCILSGGVIIMQKQCSPSRVCVIRNERKSLIKEQ